MYTNKEKVLSVKDVAEVLEISISKAYELFNRNDFPSFHSGTQLWTTDVNLLKWLSSMSQ
jgi:hypothetical protein